MDAWRRVSTAFEAWGCHKVSPTSLLKLERDRHRADEWTGEYFKEAFFHCTRWVSYGRRQKLGGCGCCARRDRVSHHPWLLGIDQDQGTNMFH